MPLTKTDILDHLRTIALPHQPEENLASQVRSIAACDGYVRLQLMAQPDTDSVKAFEEHIRQSLTTASSEITQVNIEWFTPPPTNNDAAASNGQPSAPATAATSPLPNVKHIIAVGAGKGGVGKSTIAANLAIALARQGRRVGLLDGDIYGPSVPTLLGLDDLEILGSGQSIFPFDVHGIRTMTIGKMVDADKPLIWRGPMAHGAFRQLALQTKWGELDELIVDLPPGTGDVPLTLAQMLPLSGAVIVCTPQKVAQDDAVRAIGMFRQLNTPVLGVVENMSYFIGDDGKTYDLFGRGGAAAMAETHHLPLLGTIPINTRLREAGDAGDPTLNFEPATELTEAITEMAANILKHLEAGDADGQNDLPTLTIS